MLNSTSRLRLAVCAPQRTVQLLQPQCMSCRQFSPTTSVHVRPKGPPPKAQDWSRPAANAPSAGKRGNFGSTQQQPSRAGQGRQGAPRAQDWSRPGSAASSSKRGGGGDFGSTQQSSRGKPNAAAGSKEKAKAVAKPPKRVEPKVSRELGLPPFITVGNLARAVGVRMSRLQSTMTVAGYEDVRPDLLLSYDDASLLLSEYNLDPVPLTTSSDAFDVYPSPPLSDEARAAAPLRPPVVTIMGHVDHGKTTLLDKLRSASVAAGEAGGITQHIGAFSVPVASRAAGTTGIDTVTFLDTPGHAAFSAMRSRGAAVTDIVVLVVAADDGIMPQTKEVLSLVQSLREESKATAKKAGEEQDENKVYGVQLVVALSKTDKPEANPDRVKHQLLAADVQLEDYGGDVPCVHVSGKTGAGLPELEDTLAALAEMADLRAEQSGVPVEGWVIESRVEKGRGNTATVLVKRGSLETGDVIVAGQAWAKVRALIDGAGQPIKGKAVPGDPVVVTGWRTLPKAGDEVLGVRDAADGSAGAETLAKKAVETRLRVDERRKLQLDSESINEGRRIKHAEDEARETLAYEERKRRREAKAAEAKGEKVAAGPALPEDDAAYEAAEDAKPSDVKELRLIVKADFSGTIEAVVGAISGIGNADVRVKIISEGVGEPTEGDVAMAQAVGGHIIGFNVKAPRAILNTAARHVPPVKVHCDDVIYRLMTYVTDECAALLPPTVETRVTGEASIAQVFKINVKSRVFRNVAGCRVTNGAMQAKGLVRVMRAQPGDATERKVVWSGKLDSLMQGKKEVEEIRKGTECGMSFAGFESFVEGDTVQCYHTVDVPRTL